MKSATVQTISRRRKRVLLALVVTVVVAVTGLLLARPLLERLGVFIVPPSPERYAEIALDDMDQGLAGTDESREVVRQRVLSAAVDASSYSDLHPTLREAAKELGGEHSTLYTGNDAAEYAATSTEQGPKQPSANPTVSTDAGVTTLVLPELTGISPEAADAYINAATAGLDSARANTTVGWIVDLRGNGGGNLWPMLAATASLLSDGTVMSFEYPDHSQPVTVQAGTVQLAGRTQAIAPETFTTDLPIAVLIDEGTGSSGEAVAISFVGQEKVRLFGAPSYGFSTINQSHVLYDGAVLNMTVAVDADRSGKRYGVPVDPDEHTGGQSISAATAWLASQ